ncbi:putative solute carrier organic anion transporter family member 1B7 isoform X1 [Sarcophilus harrisii]|uniref:Solute carrier organic anion transporter family member n=1 Tax=Sarcophilus harrisii TaxID=9305 RepID=A0A7N4PLM0_SARHA|nr:putative solute carrier organic anion transporter family member 1B7 isoform X1 [Sarcophilus harrisii]
MAAETGISDSSKGSSQNSPMQRNVDSSIKEKAKCNNGFKLFMIALICCLFCKALMATFLKSSITHIERRFGITTSKAGLIDGSFEIGNLLLITLVSHFGAKLHIPRVIGIGCFIMAAGSILSSLPHFFMEYYTYDPTAIMKSLDNSTVPCSTDQHSARNKTSSILLESGCKNESGSPMWIYIMMGNILRGIGESPFLPLGITYIDNYAKKGHSPFYVGLLQSLSLTGSISGFLLGSLCARIYVDIGYVDLSIISIKPTDSRWIGAWWLGFIIAGILIILSGVPFFFIPPFQKKTKMESKVPASLSASNTNDRSSQKLNFKNPEQIKDPQELSGYFHSLKCLLSNWNYIIFLTYCLFSYICIIVNLTYLPKYLEQEYGQSISKSNLIFGIIIFPFTGISLFLGGYISRKLKLNIIGTAKFLLICHCCGFVAQTLMLTLNCESRPVAGLTVAYKRNDPQGDLQNISFSECNSDCNCDVNLWDPVCGDDGLTYISPCSAGCKSSAGYGKEMVFHNCSCVEVNNFQSQNSSAHLGECSRTNDCSRKFIYFVVIQSLAQFFYALGYSPGTMLTFMIVEPQLKSLAIGFCSLTLRSIGGLLTPIYFGAIIDLTCLKWATNSCEDQGSCRIYNPISFRKKFFGFLIGMRAVAYAFLIFFFIAVKKKYKENNTGLSKSEGKDVVELNLREPLNNNEHLGISANVNNETHI